MEINNNEYLQQCDPKDIVSFEHKKWISVRDLFDVIKSSFHYSGIKSRIDYIINQSDFKNTSYIHNLFQQEQNCEILRAGSSGWQKGKLKINVTLEFIPDESEVEKSPLDDIRQAEINNNK